MGHKKRIKILHVFRPGGYEGRRSYSMKRPVFKLRRSRTHNYFVTTIIDDQLYSIKIGDVEGLNAEEVLDEVTRGITLEEVCGWYVPGGKELDEILLSEVLLCVRKTIR